MYNPLRNIMNTDGSRTNLADCGDPTPSNGQANIPDGTQFGSIAVISCKPGYTVQGNALLKCLSTGRWSGNTSCVAGKEPFNLPKTLYVFLSQKRS